MRRRTDGSADAEGKEETRGPRRRELLAAGAAALAGVLFVGGGYRLKMRGVAAASESGRRSAQESAMKAGLEALYLRKDPSAAVSYFLRVLALNPSHYGATFQLARALDEVGDSAEARSYWEKMLPMTEAAHDEATADAVMARLQRPLSSDEAQAEAMKEGLDALYARNDPAAAIPKFEKVLTMNARHYGATYQLAAALDRAGRRAEATPLWRTVLDMAGTYNDEATSNTARARLGQSP